MIKPEPALRRIEPQLDKAIDVEYAAISTAAVLAVILGALSLPALFLAWLLEFESGALPLILVPLSATILALTALVRIRRSKGTLTGRRMGLAGLALGVACLVAGIALHGYHYLKKWAHEAQVLQIANAQCDDFIAKKSDLIYDRMSERFKEINPRDDSVKYLNELADSAGQIQKRRLLSTSIGEHEGALISRVFIRLYGKNADIDVNVWCQRDEQGQWEPVAFRAGTHLQFLRAD